MIFFTVPILIYYHNISQYCDLFFKTNKCINGSLHRKNVYYYYDGHNYVQFIITIKVFDNYY